MKVGETLKHEESTVTGAGRISPSLWKPNVLLLNSEGSFTSPPHGPTHLKIKMRWGHFYREDGAGKLLPQAKSDVLKTAANLIF